MPGSASATSVNSERSGTVDPSLSLRWRERPALPVAPLCADCGDQLVNRYGWCGGCRRAYCFPCGRAHFCTPSCPGNGCHVGLCVREVRDGVLAETWGLPLDE